MSLGKSLLLSGPLTLPATEGLPGFGHGIPEASGFFCLRRPLQDPRPLPESALRRGCGGCVWIPRLSPSLSLGSALACRMSSSCDLPLRETPASMHPPAWGPTAMLLCSPSPMEAETRELFLEQQQLHNK